MSILDGVAAHVAQAINGANVFYDGAFIRVRGVPDGRGGFTQSETREPMKYLIEDFSEYMRMAGNIPANERKALIVRHGLSADPKPEDKLMMDGKEWVIINTAADPAGAVFTCRVK